MFLFIKAYADGWVTINGVHVFIGPKGKITKGPAKFIGSTVNDISKPKKSVAERKEQLKKKYDDKVSGSKASGSKSKTTTKSTKSSSSTKSGGSSATNKGSKTSSPAKKATTSKGPTAKQKSGEKAEMDSYAKILQQDAKRAGIKMTTQEAKVVGYLNVYKGQFQKVINSARTQAQMDSAFGKIYSDISKKTGVSVDKIDKIAFTSPFVEDF